MSKIVVIAKTVHDHAKFLSRVRRATGRSQMDIRSAVESDTPFAEFVLFMNDHDDLAKNIGDLMMLEERGEADLRFFELRPDEDFSRGRGREISAVVVRNILEAHEQGRQELDSTD